MKQNFHCWGLLFFLVFLITFSQTSVAARFSTTKYGKDVVQISEIDNEGSEENESLNELMGMENCGNGDDEECLKRRAIAEAHLDYIYTQHRKPYGFEFGWTKTKLSHLMLKERCKDKRDFGWTKTKLSHLMLKEQCKDKRDYTSQLRYYLGKYASRLLRKESDV